MSDAVRWTHQMCLLPNHAKDLVRSLLRACRHTVCASDAESMIDLRVQRWRFYKTLLCRRAKRMKSGLLLMRMSFYVPDENRKDGNKVQQSLNNISQSLNRLRGNWVVSFSHNPVELAAHNNRTVTQNVRSATRFRINNPYTINTVIQSNEVCLWFATRIWKKLKQIRNLWRATFV